MVLGTLQLKKKTVRIPSCKLTLPAGKSSVLMVFTRKDRDFHGRTVGLPEGTDNDSILLLTGSLFGGKLFFGEWEFEFVRFWGRFMIFLRSKSKTM